ncbi:hypothetical protein RZE82_07085 [Mollicutes bacterium LVI A0039]|nr:hypothetical protein RZE82_07085 [Mollicutes bacterium LVI A0039]
MKCFASEKEREALRRKILDGEWIGLQDTVFTFKSDDERDKFMKEHSKLFNSKLDEVGYHGCGLAVLDINTLRLVKHEQRDVMDSEEEEYERLKDGQYLVDCSCWQIKKIRGY